MLTRQKASRATCDVNNSARKGSSKGKVHPEMRMMSLSRRPHTDGKSGEFLEQQNSVVNEIVLCSSPSASAECLLSL